MYTVSIKAVIAAFILSMSPRQKRRMMALIAFEVAGYIITVIAMICKTI